MSRIIIVGGGAAGMAASIFAARNGHEVFLFEKNEKLGKKLFITGKGRCNITNACDMEVLLSSVMSNSKFLYSSFYGFSNEMAVDFFEELGVATTVERGNRVFPSSNHSSDVIGAMTREMKRLGIQIHYNSVVTHVASKEGRFHHIELENHNTIMGDSCIIATGGISYQLTGSTGDGYRFATELGHQVTKLSPSLVPLSIEETYAKELQGLSLRNITATILDGKKQLYSDFGEMLFTHYGVSGPLMLSASSYIAPTLRDHTKKLQLWIDLKPALSFEQLDQRVIRDFDDYHNKQFKNAIHKLFPSKLIPVILELSGLDPNKKISAISKEERQSFVRLIKNFPMTITGLRDYNEAIITKGGVATKEINPTTMESKLVQRLYFIGEVLDVDALTGGFNLQIAWSTAYAAGTNIGG